MIAFYRHGTAFDGRKKGGRLQFYMLCLKFIESQFLIMCGREKFVYLSLIKTENTFLVKKLLLLMSLLSVAFTGAMANRMAEGGTENPPTARPDADADGAELPQPQCAKTQGELHDQSQRQRRLPARRQVRAHRLPLLRSRPQCLRAPRMGLADRLAS